tara:strand:- start:64 stop:363 length:300 start_codon:yes stop_codon:yes gene_type:complete
MKTNTNLEEIYKQQMEKAVEKIQQMEEEAKEAHKQAIREKIRHNEYIKYLQEIVGDNDEFYAEGGRFDEIRKNTPQMIEEELQAEKDMKHRHKMNQTAF